MKLLYSGSVKDLWSVDVDGNDDQTKIDFEFTDAYSVFDWGRMPDLLPGKGKALASIAAHYFQELANRKVWKAAAHKLQDEASIWSSLFEFYKTVPHAAGTFSEVLARELGQLQETGLISHFCEKINFQRIRVKSVEVRRPTQLSFVGQGVFDYSDCALLEVQAAKLIPLEVVFRWGIPEGSSFLERLTPDYARALGFQSGMPAKNKLFSAPIVEFFTKLESQDRFLRTQEALEISGVSAAVLSQVVARTLLVATYLRDSLDQKGLELWDGKFEWAYDPKEGLILVDTIGPDELRLIEPQSGQQISKEFLRKFYRNSNWFANLIRAKEESQSREVSDWKSLMPSSSAPGPLSAQFRSAAMALYPSLAQAITGEYHDGALSLNDLGFKIQEALHTKRQLRVAVLGSGGREHALADHVSQSPQCERVFVLPGNPGMKADAHSKNIDTVSVSIKNINDVVNKLKELQIDFVIIGPDELLMLGYVDTLTKEGFLVFGPRREAAKLEWSKSFAKDVLQASGVPTAAFRKIRTLEDGLKMIGEEQSIQGTNQKLVLKYDGLALGKGVQIVHSHQQAREFLERVFVRGEFEASSENPVVICEEFIEGREFSLFAICDGDDCVVLEPACDHKRLKEGNQGPNTGGMGAFSPVTWLENISAERRDWKRLIFMPVLQEMKKRGTPFRGLLYAGMMITAEEKSYVLEFNARFGDPETQVLLPRLSSDLLPILISCSEGPRRLNLSEALQQFPITWTSDSCVNVVAASRGYPERAETDFLIEFAADDQESRGVRTYFAAVKKSDGVFKTAGGRVLSVSALGRSLKSAREKAYKNLTKVNFEGMYFRRDIGGFDE